MIKFIDQLKNKITIPDSHWYESKKNPGTWLPSVTTFLDVYPKGANYIIWLKNVGLNASQILKEAGELGSNVHAGIDLYVKSGHLDYLDKKQHELWKWEEWELLCKAMEFFTIYKPEIIVHEFSFACDELGYGGTIDMICKIDNEIWLIDYKSGNGIYESHFLQIAAYIKAWELLNPQYPIAHSGLLHLKAQTRKESKDSIQGKGWKLEQSSNTVGENFEYFQYCQKLWYRANPNAVPKILEYPLSFKNENFIPIPVKKERKKRTKKSKN
jgi:hypothetical protein